MLILLVVADPHRRRALAETCRKAVPAARCIGIGDNVQALLVAGAGAIDVVIHDGHLVGPHAMAWLAQWRRVSPACRVFVLGDDLTAEHARLHAFLAPR